MNSRDATAGRRSSAHLGATLRSVLVAPTAGFEAARRQAERRARTGQGRAEGYAPYVLAAIGGAALFVLWLKLSALLGLRDVAPDDFRWSFLIGATVIGAVVALIAQWLFGAIAARAVDAPSEQLRMVWGAAGFPQAFALLFLLPCDALVVGPEAFTSAKLEDPVSSAWAALSIAVGVALALWSWGLLVKGLQVVAGVRLRTALLVTVGAAVCLGVVVAGVRFAAVGLMGSLT